MEQKHSSALKRPLWSLPIPFMTLIGLVQASELPYLSQPVQGYIAQAGTSSRAPYSPSPPPDREILPREKRPPRVPVLDTVLQTTIEPNIGMASEAAGQLTPPLINIAGQLASGNPPDPVGDIGRNHYVQMINTTRYRVFDKQGHRLTPSRSLAALWANLPNTPGNRACSQDQGDPIVAYDHLADRWLMSQFAQSGDLTKSEFNAPYYACIALSRTPDPVTGDWFAYAFELPQFPDYLKLGVWPDGYYMSSVEGNRLSATVFDRNRMLEGQSAKFARFELPSLGTPGIRDTRMLPSDLDGPPPPDGTPNYYVRPVDGRQHPADPIDRIEIYAFRADFAKGLFSFKREARLTAAEGLAPFDIMNCNRQGLQPANPRDCIPQPGGAGTLDALSNRPMMPLKFRHFASGKNVLLFNQTINAQDGLQLANGTTPQHEVAGIRWYQLERPIGENWQIGQQGTFAPQATSLQRETQLTHRWMGSTAMDGKGNLALAYQIVNASSDPKKRLYPGIAYSGRHAGDTPNQLTAGEFFIARGSRPQWPQGGASVFGQRWGDYSALNVDPEDDCTFWYTQHLASGTEAYKTTRIASFRFSDCNANPR